MGNLSVSVAGTGKGVWQIHRLRSYYIAVFQHVVVQLHAFEVEERIGIADFHSHGVLVDILFHAVELDVLVSDLHFLELGAFVARGGNHTIAAEVALVRAGIVVAGVQAVLAFFHFLRVVNGLVNPVPNTTTSCGI